MTGNLLDGILYLSSMLGLLMLSVALGCLIAGLWQLWRGRWW